MVDTTHNKYTVETVPEGIPFVVDANDCQLAGRGYIRSGDTYAVHFDRPLSLEDYEDISFYRGLKRFKNTTVTLLKPEVESVLEDIEILTKEQLVVGTVYREISDGDGDLYTPVETHKEEPRIIRLTDFSDRSVGVPYVCGREWNKEPLFEKTSLPVPTISKEDADKEKEQSSWVKAKDTVEGIVYSCVECAKSARYIRIADKLYIILSNRGSLFKACPALTNSRMHNFKAVSTLEEYNENKN